jgi:predicted transcriptional regulator
MTAALPPLSRRERQIMDIIYAKGEGLGATAADIHVALPDPPSYSAVRAILRILERKGHIHHRSQGKRHLFLATTPRKQAARSALRCLLDTFFAGSIEQALATHLADPRATLTDDQAARLTRLINESRERGD